MKPTVFRFFPKPSPRIAFFLGILITFGFPLTSFSQNHNWEAAALTRAQKIDGQFDYVSLQDLAEILAARTYYSNKVRKAILYLDEKITVTANNPYVIVGKSVVQMPLETQFWDGDIYVPIKFFTPIIKTVAQIVTSEELDVTTSDIADLTGPNISGVRVEEKANGTLIRVKTLREFDANAISTRYSRKWLYVELLNGRLDEGAFASEFEKGLVRKIEPTQLDQMAQISLQLRKDISDESIEVSRQGHEIWVLVHTNDALNPDLIKQLKSDQAKWRIDKIVIDPGHGGRDPGAIGRGGVQEKDVVLAIAKQLKHLLETKLHMDVFITRDRDVYVPLRKRTQLANQVGGKLFISLHANSNRNRRVNGVTTYFLGQARSEEALEIAARENAVVKYDTEGDGQTEFDESMIFASMAQTEYNKESQDLAAIIQKAIRNEITIYDRGVKQAGFHVLVGASMPNVLVETAFISNAKEETLLNTASFQKKMAEAIYESVKQFKEKYEGF